jgi:diguanylate cyclase (GGDEF)-like protein/PAS domain S-box-containing protein
MRGISLVTARTLPEVPHTACRLFEAILNINTKFRVVGEAMNGLVIPGLYLFAGIMVYATFHHLSNALSPPRDPVQVLFGCICAIAIPFTLFHVQMLQATDTVEYVRALKWNLSSAILLFILFLWFIALHTGKHHWLFPAGFSLLFAMLFVVNLALPFSLQYDHVEKIQALQLPWGEVITRGNGHTGFWAYMTIVGVFAAFGYAIYALASKYSRSRLFTDMCMLYAIGIFLLVTILGILTRLSLINFVEPGPIGMLTMVIVMSVALTSETRNRLRESETRFRTVIEQSPIGMAFGRDGMTVEVNDVYLQMFGYNHMDEVCGHPLTDQIAPQCRAEAEERIRRRILGEQVETSYETIGIRRDGSLFPIYISAKRLVFNDGPMTFAFLIDISQRKESEEEIKHLAFHDHLTGLPNRRLLLDRLQQALASSARSTRHGALLLIDMDDFKTLNDTHGHIMGDSLLQQVAERLKSCVREGDTVARLGGDEFVLILENLSEEPIEAGEQIKSVGTQIHGALGRPFQLALHQYKCTISVGATLFKDTRLSKDELIMQADIAMYQAKKAGRNTLRFFDPLMQEAINARAKLEGELRKALESGQFHLYFQVQMDYLHRPIGAETLIRWIHPERGLIAPAQFIPLAEETGLILPIGQWVLENACRQIKAWEQDALTCELALSVNVSAKQFQQSDFALQVRDSVRSHGIEPGMLKLELTESMLVENIEDTIATMNDLNEIGVQFSLDDFGTGYSSMQYLKRLPLEQIKIDRSFIHDIADNASDRAIVQTIIAMAQSLNLNVIAEGVETEEQRDILIDKGCKYFQGFLLGRPVPGAQFEASLKRQ